MHVPFNRRRRSYMTSSPTIKLIFWHCKKPGYHLIFTLLLNVIPHHRATLLNMSIDRPLPAVQAEVVASPSCSEIIIRLGQLTCACSRLPSSCSRLFFHQLPHRHRYSTYINPARHQRLFSSTNSQCYSRTLSLRARPG